MSFGPAAIRINALAFPLFAEANATRKSTGEEYRFPATFLIPHEKRATV